MPVGPGKYDEYATMVREATEAEGVIVIVMDGKKGGGFSCQATPEATARLPDMLEFMARQIRADMQG